ncbi:MAG: response regulator [Bacteroidia bacterium]|nr:response regulator [Bacteroidia bacterium]
MNKVDHNAYFGMKYALLGILLGCFFPILGFIFQVLKLSLPLSLGTFFSLQQSEPLIWVIDTAPLFLGVLAYIIGRKQDELNHLNANLKNELDSQIKELAQSNTKLQSEVEDHIHTENQLKVAVKKAEDASRAKTEFLSTMSHEIRTPLNAVIGMTGLLLDTKLSGQQVDFVRTIKVGGESLLSVINDILDYSKIEAGMLELEEQAFNTLDPIEDVADLLAGKVHQRGLEFVYDIAEGVPAAIYSDLTRLRQVLVNLVGNAVKFTEEGEIQIRITTLGSEEGKEIIQFEVKDTGIGIPKEKIGRLFKSFSQVDASTTRKYGGTGLGLAICKKIVEAMEGKIWVTSQLGKGSSFFFTVKARKAEVRRFEMLDAITIFKGKRILLVDDNQTNLNILERQCRNWGFEVKSFINSKEALHFAMTQEPFEAFDLCITDMQMPELDGLGLSKNLRKNLIKCPPIILLSSIDNSILEEGRALFDYVLSKPAKNEQLFNALARILGWKKNEDVAEEDETVAGSETQIRTLLAEDNSVNQKVASHMLKKLKIEADVAGNGQEALELAMQFRYDLILMDMQMPVMNGLESTEKIIEFCREKKYPIPTIIAMTANSSREDREICIQAGMKDFITKPVSLKKLKEVIESYFETSPA